jgi:hypothetical protein
MTTTNNINQIKLNKRFWLNRGCINYIINWNAGLDCFGNRV